MPIQQRRTNREEFLEVMADREHVMMLKSNFLDRAYFLDDAALQRIVRPGMIVAKETNTKKYVPYHVSALYGVGSDTAVGILDVWQDATQEDPAVAPVFHGKVIEAHAYVFGGTLGTVAAAIKTDLNMIEWV